MNKVITLNLNGNAYQLEESGYEALRAYLETAARRLDGNPDKAEILADIEQAIADKFRARLGPHKTVIIAQEVSDVIAAMGPVEDATAADSGPAGATPSGQSAGSAAGSGTSAPVRRLYKIRQGAMLAGVCNGLAVYTNLDVTVIRVLFALLTVLSYGSGGLVYLLLALLLPAAETPAEQDAAFGGPSTAQEFIRRAREGYYEGMKSFHDKAARREWKRKFRRDMRDWRRGFHEDMAAGAARAGSTWHTYWRIRPHSLAGTWPALVLISAVRALLALGWILAMLSLVATGAVFGFALPAGMPLWLGLILLFVAYRFIVWPLRAARHACYWHAGYGMRMGGGFADSFVWLGMLIILVWLADRFVPQAHTALQQLPPAVHHAVDSFREWWARR
jgi:phage shock protein PspC (stress-responsive transcriptional regulator)